MNTKLTMMENNNACKQLMNAAVLQFWNDLNKEQQWREAWHQLISGDYNKNLFEWADIEVNDFEKAAKREWKNKWRREIGLMIKKEACDYTFFNRVDKWVDSI